MFFYFVSYAGNKDSNESDQSETKTGKVLAEAYGIHYSALEFKNSDECHEFYALFEKAVQKLGYRHVDKNPAWTLTSFDCKDSKLETFVNDKDSSVKSAFFWHQGLKNNVVMSSFQYCVSGDDATRNANITLMRKIGYSLCKELPKMKAWEDDYEEAQKTKKSESSK